jgi:hypothetical protein
MIFISLLMFIVRTKLFIQLVFYGGSCSSTRPLYSQRIIFHSDKYGNKLECTVKNCLNYYTGVTSLVMKMFINFHL